VCQEADRIGRHARQLRLTPMATLSNRGNAIDKTKDWVRGMHCQAIVRTPPPASSTALAGQTPHHM